MDERWEADINWKDSEERVGQVEDWYAASYFEDGDWVARAEESYDFYFGETWTPSEIAELNEKGAPALSVNKVQSRVNMISAISRMNRFAPRVKAETDSQDVPTAQLLTHIMRHINNKTDQDFTEALQFLDAVITGRGYYAGDVSFDRNFFGDIHTRYIDPFAIKFDPTSIMPDLSDSRYIIEERWFTVDEIASNWRLRDRRKDRKKLSSIMRRGTRGAENFISDYFVSAESRHRMGQYKVLECWHRRFDELHFLVNLKTGYMHPLKSRAAGESAMQENPDEFFLVDAFKPKVQVTVTCCGAELYHGDSPFSSPIIPIFPLFCFHAGGRQDGVVQAMKDPQLETNKRRSQMLHLINQHANMVWVVDEGGLVKGVRWLQEHATESGLVIEKNPGTELRREPPGDFPMGLVHLEQLSAKDFIDVLGVSPETMPTSSMGSGGSGRAIALRQQQGNLMLSIPMDNQRLTRRTYGRWQLRTIQDYYTTERIFRIEGEEGKDKYIRANGKTSGGIINDVTIGEYDVVVTEEPLSPTNRQALHNDLMEMVHQGYPIPPDILLRYSDIPDKDEVIQRMLQAAQQAQEGQSGAKGSSKKGQQNAIAQRQT